MEQGLLLLIIRCTYYYKDAFYFPDVLNRLCHIILFTLCDSHIITISTDELAQDVSKEMVDIRIFERLTYPLITQRLFQYLSNTGAPSCRYFLY